MVLLQHFLSVSFHASASYKKKSISERREKEMREKPAHPYLYVACWEKNSNNKKESKVIKTEKNRKSRRLTCSIAGLQSL
jgi:hypothetical protein